MSILSQQKQSVNTDFPNLRPSLDLRFALAKKLDPRITFTRGSTGTYFGPDGLMRTAGVNEPRFNHDPVTGQSLGLLIEESRTNLITRGDIEGTVGAQPTGMFLAGPINGQTAVVSTDVSLGPNGQSCKHTRGAFSDNNIGYIDSGLITAGQTYVFSAYVYIPSSQAKNFVGKYLRWGMESANSGSTLASANVTIVDRWQRVFGTCVPTGVNAIWVLRTDANVGSFFYTDCWQLELGAFPTSYMPASGGSQFTRSVDLSSMTGTNFSSWYNQTEGTVIMDLRPNYASGGSPTYRRLLSINNSSGVGQDNVIQVIVVENINTISPALWNNSTFQAGGSTTILPDTSGKVAIAVSPNYVTSAGKGLISDRNTSAILPTMNRMDIGGYGGLSFYTSNATHSRITYYPMRLTEQQLINLTS